MNPTIANPLFDALTRPWTSSATACAAGSSRYRLRLAAGAADVRAAQALRFAVFNVEMASGLRAAYEHGLDADRFDDVCEHLLVEDTQEDLVVGTYRMQTGMRALCALGYYSSYAFDMQPFEAERARILELGRACVHPQHRSFSVLNLLWRGIAQFARENGSRYLIGCSSIAEIRPGVGAAAWQQLQAHLAPAEWQTRVLPGMACPLAPPAGVRARIPRLLSAYLALGASICAPPALDLEFGSIDFLTLLDLQAEGLAGLPSAQRYRG
jgi:putative hemolysin